MSLFKELIESTYVDHAIEGKEYYFPCNRYISYSKKLLNSENPAESKEMFEYINCLFGMFRSEFPNQPDPSKVSDMALSSFYAAFDAFNKDNNEIFSGFEKAFNEREKKPAHFSLLYASVMKSRYGKTVKSYASCQELYKQFDPNLSCCKTCTHLCGKCFNDRALDEETILRYVLTTKSNFDMLREFLTLNTDKLFKCSIDLHSAHKQKDPLYPAFVPIFNSIIKAILVHDEVWAKEGLEVKDILKGEILPTVPGADNIADILLEQFLIKIVLEVFKNADTCDDASFDKAVHSILGNDKFHVSAYKPSAPAVKEQNQQPQKEPKQVKAEPVENNIPAAADDDELPFALTKDDMVTEEPLKDDDLPTFDKPVDADKSEDQKQTDVPAAEETQLSVADLPERVTDSSDEEITTLTETGQSAPAIVDSTGGELKDASKVLFSSYVKNKAEDDYVIDNRFDHIDSYALHLTDPVCRMQFENTVLSDRFMAIEALYDETGKDFLLFWGRGKKSFYYLYMEDKDELELIKPYLTRNAYIKICYQPYHIYALGRKYGIEIKRVFSIQTCYSFFNRGERLESYEDTINSFCTVRMGEKQKKPYPMLLCGMQVYPYICSQCNKKLQESRSLGSMDVFVDFDEAIGRSYYIENLYENATEAPAFKLGGPNVYTFPIIQRGKTLIPGRYFDFQIGEGYTESEAHDVIRGVIAYLAERGRFRKANIYIVYLTNMTVRFFIPEYYVHYFETSFSSIFTDIAKKKVGKKLKLLLREDIAEAVEKHGDPDLNNTMGGDFATDTKNIEHLK